MRLPTNFHLGRLKELYSMLEQRGATGALIINPLSLFYLTGLWDMPIAFMERPNFLLATPHSKPVLFTSIDVATHTDGPLSGVVEDVRSYKEYPYSEGVATLEWISREIERSGVNLRHLAVEDNYTPISDGLCEPWFEQIAGFLGVEPIHAGEIVGQMRARKEPEEVDLIRGASTYADELVRQISIRVSEGCLEEDVGRAARGFVESKMRRELSSITPSIATGHLVEGTPRSYGSLPSTGSDRALAAGAPIAINCFAVVGGYHSESERSGVIGRPTPEQRAVFDVAVEAQQLALERIGPGVTCDEVDEVARSTITRAGFEYLYGVGHGVGLLAHEPPWLKAGNKTMLEPGMCVTVEPGVTVPGEGEYHCSQTVLVTSKGHEALTVNDGIHRLEVP